MNEMSGWTQFFLAIVMLWLGWSLYQQVRHNPNAFSKGNFYKTAYVFGILALVLIVMIAILVKILS
jgi:type IV secretory pathway component VirB8